MKRPIHFHDSLGFSLVELMVATAIGLLLLFGLGTIYVNNKQLYTMVEQRGRMQENLRFSMDMVTSDLRLANYKGCRHDASLPDDAISGIDGTDETPDEMTVRSIGTAVLATYSNSSAGGKKFEAVGPHDLKAGDIAIIQNCNAMEAVQVASIEEDSPSSGTDTITLTSAPTDPAPLVDGTLHRYITKRYHVVGNALALNGEMLIGDGQNDRVENMQILYGQDTNSDAVAESYLAAGAVTNWDQVISVKIALLLATKEFGSDMDSNTYPMLDQVINPVDDRRKRNVTVSTIQLRNKLSTF
ncbi:MAG: PilW family protein [Candidatus Sedimenticola sp. (ex Thyasira tokunagai)]